MAVDKNALKAYQKTLITPATLQRALLDARGELADKDIFLSSAYHAQVNSLGHYLVGRTKRTDIAVSARMVWDDSPEGFTAYTGGDQAVINAGNPDIQKLLRRTERHYCIMGLACHEFAHCFFTDFKLLKKQLEELIENGVLYPNEPAETPKNAYGLKGIKDFLAKGKRSRNAVWGIYKGLDNSIEDGYIERSIIALHPGDTKKSINMLNKALFGDSFMKLALEAAEKEPEYFSYTWSFFANALLTLIEMGSVDIDPTFNELCKDVHQRITNLAPRVMRELENSYAPSRKELAWEIVLENWDLIEKQLEFQQSQMSEFEKALSELSDEELEELIREMLSQIMGGAGSDHDEHGDSNGGMPIRVFIELPCPSQEGDGNGGGDGGDSGDAEGEQGEGSGGSGNEGEGEGSGSGSGSEGQEGDSKNGDGKGKGQGQGEGQNQGQPGKPGSGDGKDGDSKGKPNGKAQAQQTSPTGHSQEGGTPAANIPIQGTASASNRGETVTIRIVPENEPSGSDDSFRNILTTIETDMARQVAHEKVEEALQGTLQSNANALATNGDWKIKVSRSVQINKSGVTRHGQVWPKISPISKTLKKELLKILQERRQGSKQTGLIQGRRLDARSTYRSDEKYFTKNRLPNDKPTVATALLIDQSGSMGAYAHDTSGQSLFASKIEAASNAALLLYDFCFDLGFPIMVAGHTTGNGNTVEMEVMASFQKRDKEDKYRICSARARAGNRDGTALNFMLSELKKRQEEIKLLFIISDGLPSDYRANENGVQHVKEVLQEAQKAGVLTFAAALNEDFSSIRCIYGDSMFEITDLARMPRTLLNVMKKFVK